MIHRLKQSSSGRVFHVYLADNRSEPVTGLRCDSQDLRVWCLRDDEGSPQRVTLTHGELGSYAAGKFAEVDPQRLPGVYEFAPPPEVSEGDARAAAIVFMHPEIQSTVVEVDLLGFDPHDGVSLGLDGFRSSTRNEHLTSIFEKIMPPSVHSLASTPISRNKEA